MHPARNRSEVLPQLRGDRSPAAAPGAYPARMAASRPTGLVGEISPRPGIAFRIAIGLCRVLARGIFGLRLELQGQGNLPRDAHGRVTGAWVAVPLPHRRWIDPFILLLMLPVEPRIVFFADGRVLFRTRFRRFLFRLLGGVVPVWPHGGPKAFWTHIAAAQRVLDAGAVFVIFPEAGPPSAPDAARRIEPGFGYLALRTRAPLVPMLIGGTGELYRGRRLVLRVLPPTAAAELAGAAGDPLPQRDTTDERAAARRIAESFATAMAPGVAELHHEVERRSAGDSRRWPWLTHWLDWDADAADRAAREQHSSP
jgi:1-acyl-sn-glycerol-3-phosphate acyltransferase